MNQHLQTIFTLLAEATELITLLLKLVDLFSEDRDLLICISACAYVYNKGKGGAE
jgi:hypothetical protein